MRLIDWENVTRDDVDFALAEFDQNGADLFLASHGFRPTTTYDLAHNGRLYPPKPLLGVAYLHATGESLHPSDFEGGRDGAVRVLRRLGYDVHPRVTP